MNFDEMVAVCAEKGDIFKSMFATDRGFQVNAQSRYGANSYVVAYGATPMRAMENLMAQRKVAPIVELEDLI